MNPNSNSSNSGSVSAHESSGSGGLVVVVSGSGGGGGQHRKDKTTRVRTVLNEKQLHTLRTCYGANPRPDALMKEQLVEMTGLSPRVIRVWFQNKRCKDKKKTILLKQMQEQQKVGARFLWVVCCARGFGVVRVLVLISWVFFSAYLTVNLRWIDQGVDNFQLHITSEPHIL
jgi:hypothetical protein